MIAWTEFDKATGAILQTVFGSSPVKPAETSTVGVIAVLGNAHTQYVDPITRQLKPLPNPNVP